MDWFSKWFWLWPSLLGCLVLGQAVVAVVRRRVLVFRNPDPDAAIYREYEPGLYWLLVTAHFLMTGLFFWMAGLFSRMAG